MKKQGVIMDHAETDLARNNSSRGTKPDSKGRPVKCSKKPQCRLRFSSQTAMEAHVRFVHDGIKECEQCPKAFLTLPRLHVHVSQVHNRERKFPCKVCSKSFCAKETLKSHMITHVENRERRWKCEVCSKTYLEEKYLLQHLGSHTGEKPHSCKICGKGFSYPAFLKYHAVVHTGERPYSCLICSKTFGQKSRLRAHEKLHKVVHTSERVRHHGCNLCDKKFKSKDHMERHVSSHTRERPYSCSYCSKSFQLRDSLRGHVSVTHLGIKKAECIFCLKMFPKRVQLFQHLGVHTKEAPYFCKICPAELKSRSSLANHHNVLHSAPKRNLTCDICSKECVSVGALTLHKYHKICHSRTSTASSVHSRSGRLEELKSHEKTAASAEPITYYSCAFCSSAFSKFGHGCNASALQQWRAHCRISNY